MSRGEGTDVSIRNKRVCVGKGGTLNKTINASDVRGQWSGVQEKGGVVCLVPLSTFGPNRKPEVAALNCPRSGGSRAGCSRAILGQEGAACQQGASSLRTGPTGGKIQDCMVELAGWSLMRMRHD